MNGWTAERRARQAATVARRQAARALAAVADEPAPLAVVPPPADAPEPDQLATAIGQLIAEVRADLGREIDELRGRVAELERRPPIREWRPDHRRASDGGQTVRSQRRAVGLPGRQKAIA